MKTCKMIEVRVCSHDQHGNFEYEYYVAESTDEAIHCARGQCKNKGLPRRMGYTALELQRSPTKDMIK